MVTLEILNTLKGTKEVIVYCEAIFGKVISDFVKISAGENVNDVVAHPYA